MTSLKDIGIENYKTTEDKQFYLVVGFPGLFTSVDEVAFAQWTDEFLWMYNGLPHSSKGLCLRESCLEMICFLLVVSPQAVLLHNYGPSAICMYSYLFLFREGIALAPTIV